MFVLGNLCMILSISFSKWCTKGLLSKKFTTSANNIYQHDLSTQYSTTLTTSRPKDSKSSLTPCGNIFSRSRFQLIILVVMLKKSKEHSEMAMVEETSKCKAIISSSSRGRMFRDISSRLSPPQLLRH